MPADVDSAVALLQKANTTDGSSLYESLTKLVAQVLTQNPDHPVDLLETALLAKKAGGDQQTKEAPPAPSAQDIAKATAVSKLYGAAEVPIDPQTGEPVEADPPNEYECDDVLGDAALFEALGVGLGRGEAWDIALAAKRLGEDPSKGVATVRFFGKFLGMAADYYVFESTLVTPPEQPEGEQPGEGEAPLEWNSGANANVYWVCTSLGGPLTQLPHVTPAQVKAARRQKKLLTGRLGAQVAAYPVFPGTEANYLRAQIARIACATLAAPAGMFAADEEGEVAKAEEWEALPAREMGAAANWTHRAPHLKAQGRCELHRREPPEDEEEAAVFEPTEEEQEEGPELLASLEGDAEVEGATAWTGLFSSSSEHVKNQVAGLRSNLWPGAFCAAQGAHFANIYVGWGVKAGPFVPAPPPPVAAECDATLVESAELPPKPKPEAEEAEGEGQDE